MTFVLSALACSLKTPLSCRIRSRIPAIPTPSVAAPFSWASCSAFIPCPSSSISKVTAVAELDSTTLSVVPPECRSTLVTLSCTVRRNALGLRRERLEMCRSVEDDVDVGPLLQSFQVPLKCGGQPETIEYGG